MKAPYSRSIATRPPNPDRLFNTVGDLIAAVEEHYWAAQGPPVAFFEIPQGPWDTAEFVARCVYQTLRFGYLGESQHEATPPLLQYMWRAITAAPKDQDQDWNLRLLFWRLEPQITIEHEPNWGSPLTREQLLDNISPGAPGDRGSPLTIIRTRLVIPGYPLAAAAAEGASPWIINATKDE